MNSISIIAPVIAGIAGGIAGIYLHGRITRDVKILLAFSGAYLFGITVLHLMPEIFEHLTFNAGYYILIGFLLQIVLDIFSKGVEHGHIHQSDQKSKQFPFGIFIALFIHSLIEGLPLTESAAVANHHHGSDHHVDELLLGVVIHKVPEAIALAALLYHYYASKKKVILMILLYSTATPIGLLLGSALVNSSIEDPMYIYSALLAIAVGIFLHVSTTIIFEADEHHKLNWRKILAILLGLGLVLLI